MMALPALWVENRAANGAVMHDVKDRHAATAGQREQAGGLHYRGVDAGQRQVAAGRVFLLSVDDDERRAVERRRMGRRAGHGEKGARGSHERLLKG
ncbi:hypothetical protein QEG98_23240 [Myxococcus sp. MxC21-1]|nr:hypothetical protein [Myxococcus sp. MxC21-1]WNZ59032.1 hypothetical protein QEG98_23240 [Myxococcus sp. MxC21-1]